MTLIRRLAASMMVVAAAIAVVGNAGADPSLSTARGNAKDLFGPAFVSTSVTKNGASHDLVQGSHLRVKFVRERGKEIVRWNSGCNYFGSKVEISKTHIDTKRSPSTDIGCTGPQGRQDRWIARFFLADPAWSLSGDQLTLSADDDEFTLERRPTD